jgi:hypothetical protein
MRKASGWLLSVAVVAAAGLGLKVGPTMTVQSKEPRFPQLTL